MSSTSLNGPLLYSSPPPRPSLDSTSSSKSNMKSAWTSFKRAAKEHHASVNAAYDTYYSGGRSTLSSRPVSLSSTPRNSTESVKAFDEAPHEEVRRSMVEAQMKETDSRSGSRDRYYARMKEEYGVEMNQEKSEEKLWGRVKRAAKEHHRGMNAAYATYYGKGMGNLNVHRSQMGVRL